MSKRLGFGFAVTLITLSAAVSCGTPSEVGSSQQGLRTELAGVGLVPSAKLEPSVSLVPNAPVNLFVEVNDLVSAPKGAWSADETTRALIDALVKRPGFAALGLGPATLDGPAISIAPEKQGNLVTGEGLAKDGRYTVLEVEISTSECAETGISPDDILRPQDDPPNDGDEQDPPIPPVIPPVVGDPIAHTEGICAPISMAHSLVNHINVVWSHWDGIVDPTGTSWDPEFLQRIVLASGGHLPTGSLDGNQQNAGHTAEWNTMFDIAQSKPLTVFDRSNCEAVRTSCEELVRLKEIERDDCLLTLVTDTELPNSQEQAHVMSIQSVVFDEATCTCEVTTDHTGRQDPADDYVGVPLDPGAQTWSISTASLRETANPASTWWNGRGYQRAIFACWSETRDAKKGDLPMPGAALP